MRFLAWDKLDSHSSECFFTLKIKVTKLNNYEESYRVRVEKVREAELVVLRKEMAVWATTLMIMVTSPVLATAAAFTTYVLTGEDHILTAAKAFAVLLLFAALRFPINYAGRLIGSKYSHFGPCVYTTFLAANINPRLSQRHHKRCRQFLVSSLSWNEKRENRRNNLR